MTDKADDRVQIVPSGTDGAGWHRPDTHAASGTIPASLRGQSAPARAVLPADRLKCEQRAPAELMLLIRQNRK